MFGGIRQLFRAAVEAVTGRAADPQPKPRRRRGETDKGFGAVCRAMLHKTGAVARGRFAALQPAQEVQEASALPSAAYEAATVYTATTLEWLMNMWEANSGMEDSGGLDDSFDTQQNHYYPQP